MIGWQAIVAALIVAAAFASGWKVNEWRNDASDLKAQQAAEKGAAAATTAAVDAIKGIEVRYVPIKTKAEVITREVPVYRDCLHTDDGLRVVNEALTGQPAPAGDPPRVPGPDGTQ